MQAEGWVMKMAKASSDEVDRAIKLVNLLEATLEPRPFTMARFPDTEDEEGAYFDEDSYADLRKLVEEIRKLCPGLMRVVFGFQVLLDNCCDPNADHLAWKPELAATMEASEKAADTKPDPWLGKCEKCGTDAHRCMLVAGHDGDCDKVPF